VLTEELLLRLLLVDGVTTERELLEEGVATEREPVPDDDPDGAE
jgi:hypothetical protein